MLHKICIVICFYHFDILYSAKLFYQYLLHYLLAYNCLMEFYSLDFCISEYFPHYELSEFAEFWICRIPSSLLPHKLQFYLWEDMLVRGAPITAWWEHCIHVLPLPACLLPSTCKVILPHAESACLTGSSPGRTAQGQCVFLDSTGKPLENQHSCVFQVWKRERRLFS